MSIALFSEILANFSASRARALSESIGIECVYALVWPDYEPPIENHPKLNRTNFSWWREQSGIPVWAWFNARSDQTSDAAKIIELDVQLKPDGWLLDIEGEWTKGAKLKTVLEAAAKTGKPCRASLAGVSASHVEYDYRELERQQFTIDWQAYFNSGEGPTPDVAIAELYQSSFVLPSWEYRYHAGGQYGYGRVRAIERDELAIFDSYLRPGLKDSLFGVLPREWGWTVDDRILWPRDPDNPPIGRLMGRFPYARTRVTLNVTRDLPGNTTWEQVAASARIPNARKRGISVYNAENTSDEVLAAIARGATS